MRIRVETGGLLGEYLPPGSEEDSAELDVAEGATVADVLRALGMPLEDRYMIALNGEVVTEGERAERALRDDDRLAIMPPLRGG